MRSVKMMKHLSVLVFAAAVLFCSCLSVWADGAVPVSEYSPQNVPALPDVLPAGISVSTGGLTLKLLGNPSLSRSTRRMLAEVDTNYLMLRVMISNDSEEKLGWLAPASFVLQDTYFGRVYGSYKLDLPASAKAADDGIQNVFFSGIEPGQSIYTTLAFDVYPDVESWVFTFAPQTYYGGSLGEPVQFQLPFAWVQ